MNRKMQTLQQFKTTGSPSISGVLLAGGQARRFGGGDKCLRTLRERTLLEHVAERAAPQVGTMIVNASGNADCFLGLGFDVVSDSIEGSLGPLAGVLTGLEWASAHQPKTQWLASFATDAPFIPPDMVKRMQGAAIQQQAKIVVATSNGRKHPVFALWKIDLAADLRQAIQGQGVRKVMAWVESQKHTFVDFEGDERDPFFNINTQDDLLQAENLLKKSDDL